jgi:hypothetical protein
VAVIRLVRFVERGEGNVREELMAGRNLERKCFPCRGISLLYHRRISRMRLWPGDSRVVCFLEGVSAKTKIKLK